MKPQIVNIINFIRGVEPRDSSLNLYEAVERQWELLEYYGLPGTFLLQYDAMQMPEYVALLKRPTKLRHEIGAWFEVVQPMAENAGLEWKGRPGYSWDWHANTGFTVGYLPKEREKLADVFMEDFRNMFGDYPGSVGSWMIDAHTLAYLEEKYGIVASCNCKDQWGTDGYTLWGGYYGQAYYPGRKNVFCPAGTKENQINVPVFRMLGSDPIYQYDAGLECETGFHESSSQPVITLEPVYPAGGGSEEWVEWFFRENFNGMCLSFGYAQVGQENSFGWQAMKDGLQYQFELISKECRSGVLRAETLADTGRWFRKHYAMTPASSLAALSDWKKQGHKSIWYNSRNYRVNIYQENNRIRIRDIHIFNENYQERYLDKRCESESFYYDNLPVMDGNRWCMGSERPGIVPVKVEEDGSYSELEYSDPAIIENGEGTLKVYWCTKDGVIELLCKEASMGFAFERAEGTGKFGLLMTCGSGAAVPEMKIFKDRVEYLYNDFRYTMAFCDSYSMICENKILPGSLLILPEKDRVQMFFA